MVCIVLLQLTQPMSVQEVQFHGQQYSAEGDFYLKPSMHGHFRSFVTVR